MAKMTVFCPVPKHIKEINMKDKLEFNKILEILATFAKTYVGKKLINELTPSFDVIEVANRQAQTSCAIDMINKYGLNIFIQTRKYL